MSPATVTAVAVLLAGVGAALQATLLAIIGRRVGVLATTTLAAVVGLLGIAAATLIVNRSLEGVAAAARQPLVLWIPGGLLGVAVLATLAFAPPRIGTFGTFALLIGGQLVASVLIDSLGLFGVDRVPLSPTRLAGLALVLAGGLLALRR